MSKTAKTMKSMNYRASSLKRLIKLTSGKPDQEKETVEH
jgi:hypothetical protein